MIVILQLCEDTTTVKWRILRHMHSISKREKRNEWASERKEEKVARMEDNKEKGKADVSSKAWEEGNRVGLREEATFH